MLTATVYKIVTNIQLHDLLVTGTITLNTVVRLRTQ